LALFEPRLGRDKIQTVKKPTPNKNEKFYKLPEPVGSLPYHLSLGSVIPSENIRRIEKSGSISFHIVGDTGDTKRLEASERVEEAMESDFDHKNDISKNPSFFYHLGDVVYNFGESDEYYSQFYEPYAHYPAPIFAIPGNKDGDVRPHSNQKSLEAFVNNFCNKKQEVTQDAGDINRDVMIQPNVYWTLEAPFVTIIGLYSNVLDGGEVKNDQRDWLIHELTKAPQNKALMVSVHHAPFSADEEHSGSDTILRTLDKAFEQSERKADIVLSGHVHNYQRFTRESKNKDGKRIQIPYVVLGTGGHWKLHRMQQHAGAKGGNTSRIDVPFKISDIDDNVVLESFCDNRHGFMRIHVTTKKLSGKFYSVPSPPEPVGKGPKKLDEFELDLEKHKLLNV
jgi:acid phosphatase type 7